jgi:DivIVA domain-containing protein
MPAQAGPGRDPYGRYDDQGGYDQAGYDQAGGYGGGGFDGPPSRGGFDGPPPGRGGFDGPPARGGFDGPPPGRGGFDGPPTGGFGAPPGGFGGQDRFGGPPDDRFGEERFDGFAEPGRHGKADMTAEIRMPERGMVGPPPGMSAGPGGLPPELQRIDQLRRTFQVRRFGSGYDPVQVDRLFEGLLAGLTGRGPMPMNPAEIDQAQFGLVPGGYFEAEVDAALKAVQDILRRQ